MNQDWLKKMQEAADKFWNETYPKKSFDDKVQYWKETLEKGMREQEKLGLPIFGSFNKEWYHSIQEQEPEIDKIIETLFSGEWSVLDKNAFLNAISSEDSEIEEE